MSDSIHDWRPTRMRHPFNETLPEPGVAQASPDDAKADGGMSPTGNPGDAPGSESVLLGGPQNTASATDPGAGSSLGCGPPNRNEWDIGDEEREVIVVPRWSAWQFKPVDSRPPFLSNCDPGDETEAA